MTVFNNLMWENVKKIEGEVFNKCKNFQKIKDMPTCKPSGRLVEAELTQPNVTRPNISSLWELCWNARWMRSSLCADLT
jgi:hypothetical protein